MSKILGRGKGSFWSGEQSPLELILVASRNWVTSRSGWKSPGKGKISILLFHMKAVAFANMALVAANFTKVMAFNSNRAAANLRVGRAKTCQANWIQVAEVMIVSECQLLAKHQLGAPAIVFLLFSIPLSPLLDHSLATGWSGNHHDARQSLRWRFDSLDCTLRNLVAAVTLSTPCPL